MNKKILKILNDSLETKLEKYGHNIVHNLNIIGRQYQKTNNETIRNSYESMFHKIIDDMSTKYNIEQYIIKTCKYNFEKIKRSV